MSSIDYYVSKFSYANNTSLKNFIFSSEEPSFMTDTYSSIESILNSNPDYSDEYKEFFKKSLYLYALKNSWNLKYTGNINSSSPITKLVYTKNGLLTKSSVNCIHSVILFRDSLNINHFKFIKVVPYTEDGIKNDCIIFDIINGFIFNLICSIDSSISEHITTYDCSFLSYYYSETDDINYWDYHKLLFLEEHYGIDSDIYSPYNPHDDNKEFRRILTKKEIIPEPSSKCYKKAYICCIDAVKHISLYTIIKTILEFDDSDEKKDLYKIYFELILEIKFKEFFNFLLKIGINYGFHHNDMHSSNIIFDLNTKNLRLIDYGRSIFVKYLNEESDEINLYLIKEIDKLNYNLNPNYSSFLKEVKTYKELFDIEKIFSKKWFIYKSYRLHDNKYYYPMIIFDLISISCKLFYYIKVYLERIVFNSDKYSEFIEYFNKIYKLHSDISKNFTINNSSDNIDMLFQSYSNINNVYIKTILNKDHPYFKYKDTFKIVLDGLLLTALVCLFFKKTDNSENIFMSNYFFGGDVIFKKRVINFIIKNYNSYQMIFINNDHYLYTILTSSISGGFKQTSVQQLLDQSIFKEKILSQSLEFEKELEELYKNTYDNKESEELLLSESTGGFNKNKKKYIRKLKRY